MLTSEGLSQGERVGARYQDDRLLGKRAVSGDFGRRLRIAKYNGWVIIGMQALLSVNNIDF
jgi:hypothetical protein